jgi:Fe-S-cluster containining protein
MSTDRIPDLNEIGNIFFQDGYHMARGILDEGITKANLLRLVAKAYEAMDGLILSFRNRCLREGLRLDCRQGCSWCCHQAVLASTHEVLLISDYLAREMTDEQRQACCRNARNKESVTGNMRVEEFLRTQHPCPFLKNRSCQIYPVRPMACRCYLSAEESSCLAQYRQPESKETMAALYDFPLQAGRSLNEGIRAVLMHHGLITSEWLLEVLTSKTCEDDDLLDEWLSGKDPFGIRSLSAEENEYLREYREKQGSSQDGD